MNRGLVLATVAALLLVSASAGARHTLESNRIATASMDPVDDGYEAQATFLFELSETAGVYAKVLPTPANVVYNGSQPNGTTDEAHTTGLSGWWVTFSLTGPEGDPLEDAQGQAVPSPLGTFADNTPTGVVELAADQVLALQVQIHAPQGAFVGAEEVPVYLALGLKAPTDTAGWSSSGASQDEATSLRVLLSAAQPSDDSTGDAGGGTGGGTTQPGTDPRPAGPGTAEGPGGSTDPGTEAGTSLAADLLTWALIILGAMLFILLLLLIVLTGATIALVVLLWRRRNEAQEQLAALRARLEDHDLGTRDEADEEGPRGTAASGPGGHRPGA